MNKICKIKNNKHNNNIWLIIHYKNKINRVKMSKIQFYNNNNNNNNNYKIRRYSNNNNINNNNKNKNNNNMNNNSNNNNNNSSKVWLNIIVYLKQIIPLLLQMKILNILKCTKIPPKCNLNYYYLLICFLFLSLDYLFKFEIPPHLLFF